MGRKRTVVLFLLTGTLLTLGVRHLGFLHAVSVASETQPRIAMRYSEGCVATIREESRPEPVACRIGGVRIDSVFRQPDDGEMIAVFALCLDADHAAATRYVADLFDAQGRRIGSAGPIPLFDKKPHFGEPICSGGRLSPGVSLPFVVALRPPRPGE